jgi:hypothetical protein
MKKIMLTGVIASVVLGSLVPLNLRRPGTRIAAATLQSSITGRISPIDGAELIWAISATDSIKVAVASGSFSAQVKPGHFKLIVDAKNPYKDVLLDNLEVKENQVLDVGEIILQQ